MDSSKARRSLEKTWRELVLLISYIGHYKRLPLQVQWKRLDWATTFVEQTHDLKCTLERGKTKGKQKKPIQSTWHLRQPPRVDR